MALAAVGWARALSLRGVRCAAGSPSPCSVMALLVGRSGARRDSRRTPTCPDVGWSWRGVAGESGSARACSTPRPPSPSRWPGSSTTRCDPNATSRSPTSGVAVSGRDGGVIAAAADDGRSGACIGRCAAADAGGAGRASAAQNGSVHRYLGYAFLALVAVLSSWWPTRVTHARGWSVACRSPGDRRWGAAAGGADAAGPRAAGRPGGRRAGQPWRDLASCSRKEPIRPAGPSGCRWPGRLLLVSRPAGRGVAPFGHHGPPFPACPTTCSWWSAVLLLGTVAVALVGLDTGTAFGGMGSSRHMTIARTGRADRPGGGLRAVDPGRLLVFVAIVDRRCRSRPAVSRRACWPRRAGGRRVSPRPAGSRSTTRPPTWS